MEDPKQLPVSDGKDTELVSTPPTELSLDGPQRLEKSKKKSTSGSGTKTNKKPSS